MATHKFPRELNAGDVIAVSDDYLIVDQADDDGSGITRVTVCRNDGNVGDVFLPSNHKIKVVS